MKKRLAIIVTHPIQYNVPLYRVLTERGNIDVMVFYTWGTSVLADKYDPGFGRVIKWDIPLLEGYASQFPKNTSSDPGSHHYNGIVNPDIIDQINAWQPDALLVYGWNFKSHLKVMRYYKDKIPVFFRGDSTLLNDQPGIKTMLRRIALKWVYVHVDKAFYVGRNNKEYFRMAGLKEKQLVLAPHAVDNDFFRNSEQYHEEEAQKWRLTLGIDKNSIVFLYAGKLERVKSPFLLLEAFNTGSFPSCVHLVFVGNGELETSLKTAATTSNIHFIEFQNQKRMPVVYRLADVVILPSVSETWGLAINEAMACGRPVIASSRCGGAIDLIQEGVNGAIFKTGDVRDLRDKMNALLSEKSRLKEMGYNAEQSINRFSMTRIAEEIEHAMTGSEEI
jgi:glycosyltransferase involved in cell wall biosynthesis